MKAERLEEFDCIFNPGAVAVIGASQGDDFTAALMSTKLRENLFLVNPKYKEILGKKCHASILDIKDEIDYVVIAVPASLVPKVLGECIEKGVKAAHIFSAGFSETGLDERVRLENEVKEVAEGKIKLIGPNCMGIYCPKSGLSFSKNSSPEEGPVGVVSQSGTFAILFAMDGKIKNVTFSKVISYGNAIDLDCPDFLEYLSDDPETKIIALYIEGTTNGKRLKSALDKATRKKPVVALKGGITKQGSRAASSHTASLAGSPEIWSSLFKQTGVVQVENFDELADTILAFTCSPPPQGKGVSIITSSGGFSVTETDSCVKVGLEVPQLEKKTIAELRKILPAAGTSIGNPLDAWPMYYNVSGMPGTISDVIKLIALDKNIHALIVHLEEVRYMAQVLGNTTEYHLKELISILIDGCEHTRDKVGKPVMICIPLDAYSEKEDERRYCLMVKKAFTSQRFPVYSSIDASINALSNLYKYNKRFHNE